MIISVTKVFPMTGGRAPASPTTLIYFLSFLNLFYLLFSFEDAGIRFLAIKKFLSTYSKS